MKTLCFAVLLMISTSAAFVQSAHANTPKSCSDIFQKRKANIFEQPEVFQFHTVKLNVDGRSSKDGEVTFLNSLGANYSFAFKAKAVKDIFISTSNNIQTITHAQNFKAYEDNFVSYAVTQLRSNIGNPRLLKLDFKEYPFSSLSPEILSNILTAKTQDEVAAIVRIAYREFNGVDLETPSRMFIEQGFLPGEKPYSDTLLEVKLNSVGILERVNFGDLPNGSYKFNVRYLDGSSDSVYFIINR